MGRKRRRKSELDLIAQAPWPAGLILGIVGFAAIQYGPGWTLSYTSNPFLVSMAQPLRDGALSGVAWLFLGICWFGALRQRFSARKKPRRKVSPTLDADTSARAERPPVRELDAEVASSRPLRSPPAGPSIASNEPAPVTTENIASLSWLQFEQLIAASFRCKGFSAELTADGADEGIDIVLQERDNVLLVQCKHWAAMPVGVNIARELFGVMHAKHARKAILATSGQLTPDARRFCEDNAIYCIDSTSLSSFVDPSAMPPQHEIAADRKSLCPLCGAAMRLKASRRSGQRFWGCSRYPACKGKRFAERPGRR